MEITNKLLNAFTFGFDQNKSNGKTITLSVEDLKKRVLDWVDKPISTTRNDIKKWKSAYSLAHAEEPKNFPLQLIYNDTLMDARLTSQLENRKNQVYSAGYTLKNKAGDTDEEQTKLLKPIFRAFTQAILDSIPFGYSLVELSTGKDMNGNMTVELSLIPRTNVVPKTGLFYPDYTEDKKIAYRELKEFGTWILEFNQKYDGLLNQAIPHVLMKKFAQSCWSELCEIYGIPPRVLKTNTQDPTMLKRGEQMMQDMGAAAWFIIDQNEEFEFAKGVATKGEVYQELIRLCNEEMSLLISGAMVGQDSKFGSKGKEQSSQDMLWELIQGDMHLVEQRWNDTVIPALIKVGYLKGELTLEFDPIEDLAELWNRTIAILPYASMDGEWIKNKFGVEVLKMNDNSVKDPAGKNNLNVDPDFFA